WDRSRIGAERATTNAVNVKTRLAWNWNASTTITGGRKFFGKALTDGTISRVDLCTIVQPDKLPLLRYGDYDDDFRRTLKPYIDRLTAFQNEQDEFGRDIPARFKEVSELEQRMDEMIKANYEETGDQAWISYAWRTKVSVMKKIIVLYLANGMTWEREFETFADWAFRYLMWCKLNLFKERADELFRDERLKLYVKHNSPLKLMSEQFTYEQFCAACTRLGCRRKPGDLLDVYLSRNKIVRSGDNAYKRI
ncbi:MAG: hypothetical protein HUK02_06100, partial [Bacteroidaceae bacterium]|nr:hypothetical protein [Bacteroidaceae bacterium]